MNPPRKRQRLSVSGTVEKSNESPVVDRKINENASEQQSDQQRRSLFIRSLPATATTESLTALFSDSYPIKHATAVIDPETKQCRGYGFVTFADNEDARRAKDEFNGHLVEGRRLRVEVAEPRHRNAAKESSGEVERSEKLAAEKAIQRQPPKLIVRNLPWTIKTSDQLSKLFMSYGKVKQAYIPKKASGLLAGFGFVLLRGHKNAEKAIEGVNGKIVDGRNLAVDWAVAKDVYDDLLKEEDETRETAQAGEDEEVIEETHNSDAEEQLGSTSDVEDDGDDDIESIDGEMEDTEVNELEPNSNKPEDRSSTLFIRNLPFSCEDEQLEEHFTQFGSVRYARVVMDAGTERSKGTGFVCFYRKEDADECLKAAPSRTPVSFGDNTKDKQSFQASTSILQNEFADPTGQYTLDGRVLQVSRAVDKSEANRLTEAGIAQRYKRNEDKRRLYLLSEGTIASNSALWEQLPPSERAMREASAKQRKALIESNPSLHLSLTRLSIRNIPRSIDSKELKALAREAVVGFAADVKNGSRQRLSKEELARGGDEMRDAELARKKSGKGLVKQSKVVFEGAGGSKVNEESGAGRSRGYGFIEYHTHRSALMGLRWLNGHSVGYQVQDGGKPKKGKLETQDRKKRLIVEFAIENAQVVKRRQDNELKARDRSRAVQDGLHAKEASKPTENYPTSKTGFRKRKRGDEEPRSHPAVTDNSRTSEQRSSKADDKLRKRNQIIGRKRAMRRAHKTSR